MGMVGCVLPEHAKQLRSCVQMERGRKCVERATTGGFAVARCAGSFTGSGGFRIWNLECPCSTTWLRVLVLPMFLDSRKRAMAYTLFSLHI